jgi:two-component system OmpR family response regulator
MELTKAKKIYIVDDDSAFTASLKKDLEDKANHEVMVFTNCADCLNNLSEKPEIIILDNHLNSEQKDKETNLQLLDMIRKDYPDVHVIVLAKGEGYGTAMQTILHGAEQYLMKDENTIPAIHNMIGEL